ncbi:MAG: NADH:flavin oxidoreductase [Gammaproteobacteria bacterium]|nr:NADH:flavin oxidoreductase [Gammaproteobacteria bacterium]
MTKLFSTLNLGRGPVMKNRFMLAPLTNLQSHSDGRLSNEEYHWLTLRAKGGFGLTMTCAACVQAQGQGFPGQLGIYSDAHLPGLARLATGIKTEASIAIAQLHHAGMRSPKDLIGRAPHCPSDNGETGAVAMTHAQVLESIEAFIAAAKRAEQAGFHGVELHGAHGYLICQFLSPEVNQRDDEFGGSLENRARALRMMIDGVRARCGADFILGVRLSPERFGLRMAEIMELAQALMTEGKIDFLDMSLWDCFKEPNEDAFKSHSLIHWFTGLQRHAVKLGVAGNIRTPADAEKVMATGVDWIMLGRAAIIHHDFPLQMQANPSFKPLENPVSKAHLEAEGVSEKFLNYLSTWKGFVATDEQ